MNAKAKLIVSFLVFFAVLGSLGLWIYLHPERLRNESYTTLKDNSSFTIEIVDTPASEAQGLSGRVNVPHDYGMLFVFPDDEAYGFWMKDMLVPLDMIWLSDKGEIVGIEDSVTPESYPHVFYPPEPVRYVLETRAGEARAQGWTVGTPLGLPVPAGL